MPFCDVNHLMPGPTRKRTGAGGSTDGTRIQSGAPSGGKKVWVRVRGVPRYHAGGSGTAAGPTRKRTSGLGLDKAALAAMLVFKFKAMQ